MRNVRANDVVVFSYNGLHRVVKVEISKPSYIMGRDFGRDPSGPFKTFSAKKVQGPIRFL